MSSLVKLLSSWMGLAPGDTCGHFPWGKEEKETGQRDVETEELKAFPTVCMTYKEQKAFDFASVKSEQVVPGSCYQGLCRKACRHLGGSEAGDGETLSPSTLILQTLVSNKRSHLMLQGFTLALRMRRVARPGEQVSEVIPAARMGQQCTAGTSWSPAPCNTEQMS